MEKEAQKTTRKRGMRTKPLSHYLLLVVSGKDLRSVRRQRAADQGAKLRIRPEGDPETFMEDGRLPLTNNLCFVQEPYSDRTRPRGGPGFLRIHQGSDGQLGTLHTGRGRKGQGSGRVLFCC